MAISESKLVSPTFTILRQIIDPFQTTNATQATAYSFLLGQNKGAYVTVRFIAVNSTFTAIAAGDTSATFLRETGTISRTSSTTSAGLIANIIGNFSGGQPTVDCVANTSTNAIDVKVTGKLTTTVNWNLEINILSTN